MRGFSIRAAMVLAFLLAGSARASAGKLTIEWDNGAKQVVPFEEPAPAERITSNHWPTLHSGQTLLVPSGTYTLTLDLSGLHDVTIQWDGKGQKPLLKLTPGASNLVRLDANSANITFDGFTVDAGQANAFKIEGKNLTFRNLDFTSCSDAFLAEGSIDGLTIENCTVTSDTALTSYFLWAGAGGATVQNVTVKHCTVPNSTRQHIVRLRFGTLKNVLFDNCDFGNKDRRKIDPQDDAKGVFTIQQGSGLTIKNCTIRDGGLGLGPLGGDDGANDKNAATAAVSDVSIDGCTFTGKVGVLIFPGTSNVTIRQCQFNLDWTDPNAGLGAMVDIAGSDNSHGWQRTVKDVRIDSCKAASTTQLTRFLAIRGPVEGIRLLNNTFTAPRMVCGAYGVSIISAPDPQSITESTNNTWPDAAADGWANGGVFNLGADGTGTGHGFWSPAQWLALPQVKGDVFRN